ncbi:MAG: NUDIX pyrophosphatase [Candidatus Neomarinimicrobiota bacterium]|jgi:dATP pyrophosphohydrolase|nr:NUDIX pyrophosphatase [Candidatus Neomarinimicrobiota bacterium]|tara:strand:- start:1176 stop:1649 length:474 start_codon:yes stop_codon:yes gene_type:complete
MANLKVRVVDCYVYFQKAKEVEFLLLKRNKNKLYEHLWQGVAGKIEKDEKAWETAVRELKEETGLAPKKMFVADHVSRFYEKHKDRMNLVPVFGIEVDSKDVTLSDEHIDYKWLDFEEAFDTLIWNGQKQGLKTVYNMLLKNDDRIRWTTIELKKEK